MFTGNFTHSDCLLIVRGLGILKYVLSSKASARCDELMEYFLRDARYLRTQEDMTEVDGEYGE